MSAQTPMEEYHRMRDSIIAGHNRHRDKVIADYERFRDSCNAEYARFLKEAWKPFRTEKPIEAPKEEMHLPKKVLERMENPEKIVVMQTVRPEETAFNVRDAISKARDFFKSLKPARPLVKERTSEWTRWKQKQEKKQVVSVHTQDVPSVLQKDVPRQKNSEKVHVDEPVVNLMPFEFYGTKMQVDIGDLRESLNLKDNSNDKVSDAWTLCSKQKYVGLIQDCLSLKLEYNLGDWAYLQMLKAMSEEAFGEGSDESTFLTTYIYSQSGYCVRLGRAGDKLLMLYTSHHQIYNHSILVIDSQQFYSLSSFQGLSSVNACDKAFNPQEQSLSLWMEESMKLDDDYSQTRIVQSELYPEMRMEVKVNENLIRYYNDYPNSQLGLDALTRWAIYAETPLSDEVKEQIYPTLKAAIQGLPEDEQICRLLSLIQPRNTRNSLIYGDDIKEWGGDRVFFSEETLYYPLSDCEDHAILFSRFVRDLIGLKVLLVYYKKPESEDGHLATAIHFNQTPTMGNGDALIYNGEAYYICDPTNYDPRPGVTMEGMNNAAAQVILLN